MAGSSSRGNAAVWVLIGLAVALFGLAPRVVAIVWAALGACFVLAFLGTLLSLPDWVLDVSPVEHVPELPAADFAVAPLPWLCAVAAALMAVGFAGFRRRDVPA
jgi:ABC-2 type transport system permease protein